MSGVIILRQPCLHRRTYRCAACRIAAVNAHHTADMLRAVDAERANAAAKHEAVVASARETREIIERALRCAEQSS